MWAARLFGHGAKLTIIDTFLAHTVDSDLYVADVVASAGATDGVGFFRKKNPTKNAIMESTLVKIDEIPLTKA
eukprot:COSAG05_NODE_13171_length_439_cov_0.911765_1_plen_73_part_00